MRKLGFLLAICSIFLLFQQPASRADGPGIIQGRIVNGTAGGGSVANLAVRLRMFQAQGATGETVKDTGLQTTADAQGQFRFEGLPTAQGTFYQVSTTYQDVVYSGSALQFEPGSEEVTIDLPVYETTTDDSTVITSRAHLLVTPTETGVGVTELHLLMNSGDRTYVGQGQVRGRRWTSSYQLPASARDVVFEDGAWGGRFLEIEGGLVDTEPLWPGQTTVIFAYHVDCLSGPCDLGRALQQRIANLNVMVPEGGMTVASKTLAPQENLNVQGRSYLNLAASNLAPATTLDLSIARAGSVSSSVSALPATNSSGLPWVILGIVVMVAYLGFPFWRQRVQEQVLRDHSRSSRHDNADS